MNFIINDLKAIHWERKTTFWKRDSCNTLTLNGNSPGSSGRSGSGVPSPPSVGFLSIRLKNRLDRFLSLF